MHHHNYHCNGNHPHNASAVAHGNIHRAQYGQKGINCMFLLFSPAAPGFHQKIQYIDRKRHQHHIRPGKKAVQHCRRSDSRNPGCDQALKSALYFQMFSKNLIDTHAFQAEKNGILRHNQFVYEKRILHQGKNRIPEQRLAVFVIVPPCFINKHRPVHSGQKSGIGHRSCFIRNVGHRQRKAQNQKSQQQRRKYNDSVIFIGRKNFSHTFHGSYPPSA